jgi:GT2 family glycosyltransferase
MSADDSTDRDATGIETDGGLRATGDTTALGHVVQDPGITFSVIVTFHNQREFVADALDSILAQDRDDLEIIAVDDASSDGTADALREYDGLVKVLLLDENQGVSGARNRGAAEAEGDYLVFFDGDDAFLPWAFDVYAAVARARRPITIFGSLQWFAGPIPAPGDKPREVQFIEYPDYFTKDRSLGAWAGATAIATHSFRQVGGWDPEFRVCEDYDLMWRLGLSGPVIYTMEPATALHRAYAEQSSQQAAKVLRAVERLVEMERVGRYPGRGLRALDRKACVGGCVLFWAIRLRRHSPRQTATLVVRSWPLVIAAVAVRLRALVRGRQPIQTIQLANEQESVRATA